MSEDDLNKALKAYYRSKTLPGETLADLRHMIQTGDGADPDEPAPRRPFWPALFKRLGFSPALATAVACLLVVSLVTWQFTGQRYTSMVRDAVLKEIMMNHDKNLVPEFSGIALADLGRLMPELDFSPVVPEVATAMKLQFTGARYCSIQGNLAVQLKYQAPSGGSCTLYQTPATDALKQIRNHERTTGAVHVRVWHENGLFMAMAGPPGDME